MLNVGDDILGSGKSPEEHDNNLKQVLSRLRKKDLTLNKKKCAQPRQPEVSWIHLLEGRSVAGP